MDKMSKKLRGLEVSTSMGCRVNCKYCPQSLLLSRYYEQDKKRQQYLTLDDFKKVLENVEPGGFISFCGMVEPFHNPQCADMICYAHEQGYRVYLFTTLMGMKNEDFEKIKNVPLDFFELHIPDAEENSHFVIDDAYKELLVKIQERFQSYTYSCHGRVHPEIAGLIDASKSAGLLLGDRAGNLDIGQEPIRREPPFLCAHGFEDSLNQWLPVMLPDGTLVACCNDYGMRHVFGNLIRQTWEEIAAGEEYTKFRRSWEDGTVDSLCRSCGDAVPVGRLPSVKLKSALLAGDENLIASEEYIPLFRKLQQAEEILIWGTGNYYRDHYQYFGWDKTLEPVGILDSNPDMWNQQIDGLCCYDPATYPYKPKSLVVLFVKNTASMEESLNRLGVDYIRVDDMFRLAALLPAEVSCKEKENGV